MITDLTDAVYKFLQNSGFNLREGGERFAFVGQNPTLLVFVVQVDDEFDKSVRAVTNLLATPFRSNRFGPKTMEMYCVFTSKKGIPLAKIEQCEQDLKVCRKVVLTDKEQIEVRLSFLGPLEDVLPAPLDLDQLFWLETEKYLSKDEVAFLKEAERASGPPEKLFQLLPKSQ